MYEKEDSGPPSNHDLIKVFPVKSRHTERTGRLSSGNYKVTNIGVLVGHWYTILNSVFTPMSSGYKVGDGSTDPVS